MANKRKYEDENEVPKALKKDTSSTKTNNNYKENKGSIRIFGRIALVIVILLIVLVGYVFWYINDKLSKMQQVDINEEELGISEETNANLSEYRNIAIFGVDSRDNNLEKGNRSDCIIIASINNNTKDVKLISVYRDTYVQIDGHGLDKITHAYSYGSAQLAINTLNKNFDLNIKEFVTVNFDSVAEAVDELGGVNVNITSQEELKYLNSYIDETAKVTGLSNARVAGIGNQNLNGVQAVAYSRIRYTAGGDYKRTERMRTVIQAMFAKLKTKSIGEINNFMDRILPKVYTNIKSGNLLSLLPSVASFKISESIGWPYNTKGSTLNKVWYGIPVTLESNVTKLHQEAFGQTDYVPSNIVKTISNQIVEKTGYTK